MSKTAEERAEEYVAGLESQQEGCYNQSYGAGALEQAYRMGWHDRDKESGWVSVVSELPTFNKRVLCCHASGGMFTAYRSKTTDTRWCWVEFERKDNCTVWLEGDVTHWQLLPEPPKEDK